ncbi:MAG: ACT domain-containing protein [Nanoarchaeota archaeon]
MRRHYPFKDAPAFFWKGRFAFAKVRQPVPGAFANIIDKDEITVIVQEGKLPKDCIAADKGWLLLTLGQDTAMDTVGVTATIAGALADAEVAIMPIAAFSRDHFLIKEKDKEKAVAALKTVGITVS